MIQTLERTKIAQEILDTHAENLKSEFSTFEELQDLFIDVFSSDINSSKDLTGLQNQFANGTLRPEIKFVPSEVLTDDYGNIRDAAFDSKSQTILLSEDLDAAGIESSIEQEMGHWWDVQLNGTKDTTTLDGKPFDEGAAYAERFSEGAEGDNIFADLVYQSDSQTILVDGQETEVEFRPIATWNINGNTNSGRNTLQSVLQAMEFPGPGLAPIEVMALQEVREGGIQPTLESIGGVTEFEAFEPRVEVDDRDNQVTTLEYAFNYNGVPYRFFYNNNTLGGNGNAIVLRDPPPRDQINVFAFADINNPRTERGFIGVETPDGVYYSIHAGANLGGGTNTGNNAQALVARILGTNPTIANRVPFILGDFNRNIATADNPNGNVEGAFPEFGPNPTNFRLPNDFTFNARDPNPTGTLDYMYTPADLLDPAGVVLNQLLNANTPEFPSDHFPVLYDDEVVALAGGAGTVETRRIRIGGETGEDIFTGAGGDNTVIGEGLEFSDPATGLTIDLSGDGRSIDSTNRISFRENGVEPFDEPTTFVPANFNGYQLEFGNLRAIENVTVDDSTNTTGIASEDIEIIFRDTLISVNLEGLELPHDTGFDLLVDFSEDFPVDF